MENSNDHVDSVIRTPNPPLRPINPPLRPMILFCSVLTLKNSQFFLNPLEQQSLRILSYNVLADMYVSGDGYDHCPLWALNWEYRKRSLLIEILSYDADILCLQEVQSDHFKNLFEPVLSQFGYSSVYKKKTREVYNGNKEYVIDGCATFFRRDKFELVKKYEVEYEKEALPLIERLEPERRNDGIFRLMKDNIATVVILQEKGNSRSRICVANTHIHCGKYASDVRLFQVINLIRGLEKINSLGIPVLVCGDLNSVPGSDAHKFLVNGKVGCFGRENKDSLGIYKHLKLRHGMNLGSAYAKVPEYSRDAGTLDYILYSENKLKVDGVFKLPAYQSVGRKRLLPTPELSSDHVALVANFSINVAYKGQNCFSSSLPSHLGEQ